MYKAYIRRLEEEERARKNDQSGNSQTHEPSGSPVSTSSTLQQKSNLPHNSISNVQTTASPTTTQTLRPIQGSTANVQPTTSTGNQASIPPHPKTDAEFKARELAMLQELKRKCDETEQMLRAAMAKVSPEAIRRQQQAQSVILGNLSLECPSTAKLVRIFTSSTFTDTEQERNAWMIKAYPRIKAFCQSYGYEFQVVDMRWGVRDEATDDHMTTELCLQELKQCQKLSTGPNFISLLSHKYGYQSLPRQIESEEFEEILAAIDSTEEKILLKKWYLKDSNAIPVMYVLSPISTHLPDYISSDVEKKQVAKNTWWEQSEQMRMTLGNSANVALSETKARKYNTSVTEKEVELGLLHAEEPEKHCIWFHRVIDDIEAQEHSRKLSRYIECSGDQDKVRISRHMLQELHEEMRKKLGDTKIHTYSVNWSNEGIDPANFNHQSYLEKITKDFESELCKEIEAAIKAKESNTINDPVHMECMHHMVFCQGKCEQFQGREDVLQRIKDYVLNDVKEPLVLHGTSGSGKTSIMAMAAKSAWSWIDGKGIIVMRFLGTSPDSSNVSSLIRSMLKLLLKIEKKNIQVTTSFKVATIYFYKILGMIAKKRKILIFLDSLDQLDTSFEARKVTWILKNLPENVKIVVSTLEDEKYEIFPELKKKLSESSFLPVPILAQDNAKDILDFWLQNAKRTLTSEQRNIVITAFNECPLPIYLKLSFDEAIKWTSYDKPETTVLQKTIRDSIDSLFARQEKKHGLKLVHSTLGNLTSAKTGLSESELEDILSCDDEVLDDVYQYWTPPLRRLPPLLLVRLKTDLQQYLIERGSEGLRVIYWYHRQFIQAAKSRYLSNEEMSKKRHFSLAQFFSGTWSETPKPYTDKQGKVREEMRYVAAHPIKFVNSSNDRKLRHLPYHWINSGQIDALKRDCLMNLNFLIEKLISYSNEGLIDDISMARKKFPGDLQIKMISDALDLSLDALLFDPYNLISQFLDRLSGNNVVEDFLEQCRNSPYPYILPDRNVLVKPGGPLVYTFIGHTGDVSYIDMFQYPDGKILAVTCSMQDDTVRLWDVGARKEVKKISGSEKNPERVSFAANGQVFICNYPKKIIAYDKTGIKKYEVENENILFFEVFGKQLSTMVIFSKGSCVVYDALTGKEADTIQYPEGLKIDVPNASYGSENFIALTSEIQEKFGVLDMKTKQFSNFIKTRGETERVLITLDETRIIRSSYDKEIVVYELSTLKKIQTYKEEDFVSSPMRLSPDGQHMYYGCSDSAYIWNLTDMTKETILSHHSGFEGIVTLDMKVFLSISLDNIIRVWDSSKESTEKSKEEEESKMEIREILPMRNTRYLVLRCVKEKNYFLQVYDIPKKRVVRSRKYDDKSLGNIMVLVDDEYVAVTTASRKVKLLRLQDMTIVKVLQGLIPECAANLVVCKNGKGILTCSRGRMNVKIYSIENGKTTAILKQPPDLKKRIDDIVTNGKAGNILACCTDDGPVLIFDVMNECLLSVVSGKDDLKKELGITNYVSESGKYVAINADKKILRASVSCFIIWDVYNKRVLYELFDSEDAKVKPSSVDSMEGTFIRDDFFAQCCDDGKTRVWDLKTGKLFTRVGGFKDSPTPYHDEGGKYFFANALMDESTRCYDTTTWKHVAAFKMDKEFQSTTMLKNGKSFVTTLDNLEIVVWNVYGNGDSVDFSKEPELFDEKVIEDTEIVFVDEKDKEVDPDDPDDDEDEKDDDDDDDDDDDFVESPEPVYDDD